MIQFRYSWNEKKNTSRNIGWKWRKDGSENKDEREKWGKNVEEMTHAKNIGNDDL